MTFHLAIPSGDLDQSIRFYKALECKIGRRYPTHVVINFFKSQLVLHKSDEWSRVPKMYPRHAGVIFDTEGELRGAWAFCQKLTLDYNPIFEPYFVRNSGEPEEHHTFFIKDPHNNLIEFKWYKDPKFNLS